MTIIYLADWLYRIMKYLDCRRIPIENCYFGCFSWLRLTK